MKLDPALEIAAVDECGRPAFSPMFPLAAGKPLISLGMESRFVTTGLHDGLTRDWRRWRLKVLDAEGAKHGCGAL